LIVLWTFDADLGNSCYLIVKMFRLEMSVELRHLFKGVAHELGDFIKADTGHREISSLGQRSCLCLAFVRAQVTIYKCSLMRGIVLNGLTCLNDFFTHRVDYLKQTAAAPFSGAACA
jgi:hypothetical protein